MGVGLGLMYLRPVTSRCRIVAACCLAWALLQAPPARAARFGLRGGHLSYGIGAAAGSDQVLRQNLDLGLVVGWFDVRGSRDGMWSSGEGWLLSASAATGFSFYPTYVDLGVGYGWTTTLAGLGGCLGPALRADPDPGGGLGLRITADLFMVQLGVHVIGIVGPGAELQATATIGLGRF